VNYISNGPYSMNIICYNCRDSDFRRMYWTYWIVT